MTKVTIAVDIKFLYNQQMFIWPSFLKKHLKLEIFLLALVLIISVGCFDFFNSSLLAANFADAFLRPLFGNRDTVIVESVFFNAGDEVHLLTDKFTPQKTEIFEDQGAADQNISMDPPDMKLINLPKNTFNFSPLSEEGIWKRVNTTLFPADTVLARTFTRPDPIRPYAIVSIIQADMGKLDLNAVAGTAEPGGVLHNFGTGKIPQNIQSSDTLIAAFNGGFQFRDGQYGMVADGKVYVPLQKNLATFFVSKDSKISIAKYTGQNIGDDSVVRQNGDMLVEDSKIVPSGDNNEYNVWGRTVTNSMYTWRSGIGITKQGNLLYAVGPSLVPETLAKALLDAGAVNAMQLDINPYWVRFVVFNPLSNGQYEHSTVVKDMFDGSQEYLQGYQKDFFYLYKKV